MGYTCVHETTHKNIVDYLISDLTHYTTKNGNVCDALETHIRHNAIYFLMQQTTTKNEITRFVVIAVIAPGPNHGWCYNVMDETCGPYYHDCPIEWLDRLTKSANNMVSEHWRQRVRDRSPAPLSRQSGLPVLGTVTGRTG